MPEAHAQNVRINTGLSLLPRNVCVRVLSGAFLLLLCSFAGHTWAAIGTVLVTAGQNTIADTAGNQRLITSGTEVSNGDTVYTGAAGHLQIRFVDGAIVALRPNTDFRVDEYRYPAAPQRSFLSLLRGALRSATGLASKEDPSNYRLTTPSATIGIRGTHFVAQETVCRPRCAPDEQAGLHVAVSEGAIVVTNDAGTIELSAGQSARVDGPDAQPVKTARAPVLSPRRYQADQPPFPETINPAPTRLALGERAESPLKLPDNYEPTRRTPASRTESSTAPERVVLEKAPASQVSRSGDVPASDVDYPGSAASTPLAGGPADPGDPVLTPPDRAQSGHWTIAAPGTNGSAGSTPAGNRMPQRQAALRDTLTDAQTDYPGPIALPAPSEQINRPRAEDGRFDLATLLPLPNQPFGQAPTGGTAPPADSGNREDDSGGSDNSAGNDDNGNDPNNGGGATTPVTPPVSTSPPAPGIARAGQWRIDLRAVPVVSRVGLVLNNQAILAFDDQVTLSAMGLCPNAFCLGRGSAIAAEAGHDEFAAWGRWTDGSLSLRILGLETSIAMGDRDGLHYLVGVPAVSLPVQGTFSYPLVGATAPTADIGWAPGRFTGAAAVQFAPGVAASVGLEGQIDIANERFSFATSGGITNPGQSQLSTNQQAGFSGTLSSPGSPGAPWFCGSGGCAVSVSGGLLGPSGERLGLGYSVISESGSTTIEGVAVFGRQ